jgi:hypothetical protein
MAVVVVAVVIAAVAAAKVVGPSNAALSPLAAAALGPASSRRVAPCQPDTEGYPGTTRIRIVVAPGTRIPTVNSLSPGNPSVSER